ncbi:MAG: hypothetical protein BJ554DRAFT_5899 [Olpidium bornovanus]|uniref:Uncharacterized protein n=1 Tax=Olpidium bornovanus TaxID=278681 RepID=A0A8H7ZYS0_9FUNG|nr:MAG: hypothetical protein BJ554DRAFT_5899 [Olpidium bornovanus]
MESPQRYAADERDASPASVSSRVRLLIPEPLCEAQDQGSVPSSTGSAGNDGGAENNGSADSNRGWESSSLLHRRPQKQPANGPQSSALAAGRAGPPRLSNISDADSSRSANTVGSFLHDDVCYSPYGSGQAIDYGALGDRTGFRKGVIRRALRAGKWVVAKIIPSATPASPAPVILPVAFSDRGVAPSHKFRRPLMFQPSFSELGRFTFYSRACGAIHSEKFAQLFDELPPTENGTETNSQKSGKQSIVDIMKAGDFWLDVTSPTVSEMKAFAKVSGGIGILLVSRSACLSCHVFPLDDPHGLSTKSTTLDFWYSPFDRRRHSNGGRPREVRELSALLFRLPVGEGDVRRTAGAAKKARVPLVNWALCDILYSSRSRTFDQDRCSPTFMRPLVYYIVVMQEGVLSASIGLASVELFSVHIYGTLLTQIACSVRWGLHLVHSFILHGCHTLITYVFELTN